MSKQSICSVEECDRRIVARGLCNMHYQRWRSNGDPVVTKTRGWPKGKPRGGRKPCTIPGCERLIKAHGYCYVHYQRWRKHGDPLKVIPKTTDSPTYRTMHCRLERYKTGHCSTPECDRNNTQMALIHGRGHIVEMGTKMLTYSDRVEDYVELCPRCHVLYDETEGWRLRQGSPRKSAAERALIG